MTGLASFAGDHGGLARVDVEESFAEETERRQREASASKIQAIQRGRVARRRRAAGDFGISARLRRVIDRAKGALYGGAAKPTSADFERFRRARRDLGNARWEKSPDGGTTQEVAGQNVVVLRFQYAFRRQPHVFELRPEEVGASHSRVPGQFVGRMVPIFVAI